MNKNILTDEVQDYLRENEKADLTRLILSGSPFTDIPISIIAEQIEGLCKAKTKLPRWYKTPFIYFPPKLNLEQTSSEATAFYKATLVSGTNLCDLTAGFGIDSYFFSKHFNQVISCELNADLAEIAIHNNKILDAKNITVHKGDGMEYLNESDLNFYTIYADPSRRNDAKGKVFMLKDCEPNIPENLDLLFQKTDTILIKTSPLLDISSGLNELKKVAAIHIVAVKNEVKELLWLLKKNTDNSNLEITTVNLQNDTHENTSVNYSSALSAQAVFSDPLQYLYEPNAALLKSGLFDWIGANFNLYKLHTNSHLYTSDQLIEFPGRRFKILEVLPYSKKVISRKWGNQKANITTRNFKESVEQIRKKFKIKDGGESYLLFTTNTKNEAVVINCEKV